MSKTYSDFERDYFMANSKVTVDELLTKLFSSEGFTVSKNKYSFISMRDVAINMEDDFHRRMLNNDEFLDMPIAAILYEKHRRCYTLALEKMENGYYIAISFYGGSITSSYTLITMSEKVDLNYKTIRDFVNSPPEGVHIPDKR